MHEYRNLAIGYAVLAAALYAVNIPCSKLLQAHVGPTMMAALLYLGAGLGVGFMYLFRHSHEAATERLTREDLPYTISMVVLDVAAPILLMWGLESASAGTASLLGNFEIVATSLIALLLFREKISPRLWTAIGLITVSSIVLSWSESQDAGFSAGALLILGATVCWGLENNCTRRIADNSSYQIVTIKGICSGLGSLAMAFVLGEKVPALSALVPALVLGFVAYGLSIFTYVRAQKSLGAAKTSAFYALAPFIGAALSVCIWHDALAAGFWTAAALMAAGIFFALGDTLSRAHAHEHTHRVLVVQNGRLRVLEKRHTHPHSHWLLADRHVHRHGRSACAS